MDIGNFYMFDSKLLSTTIQAHAITLSNKEDHDGLFDQHRLLKGIYNNIAFPVIFKQEYGKKIEDVLNTGYACLYLISSKFKEVLEENLFTGWKTFPIRLMNKKGHEIQGYYGLSVTGRCGKIDYSKSEIIEKRLVPNGPLGKYYKGLYIGLDKWDGCDFFLPEDYYGIVTTSRVAEVLKKEKLTNIRLENLKDISVMVFPTK